MNQAASGRRRPCLAALCAATLAVVCHAPAFAYTDAYGAVLQAVDYPSGTLFGYGLSERRLITVWNDGAPVTAQSLGPADLGRDRSRTIERLISAAVPVPAAALRAIEHPLTKAPPAGAGTWQTYWVREVVTPAPGRPANRQFSTAYRRFVQCDPGRIIEAGTLRFASLDAQGAPYAAEINYEQPRARDARAQRLAAPMEAEFRAVCAPVFAAALGEDSGRQRLEEVLAPPPPTAEQLAAAQMIERLAADMAAAAASAAATTPGASASSPASTGTQAEGAAPASNLFAIASNRRPSTLAGKARIRMFQYNGLIGGLTNGAACVAPDSRKAAGSGNLLTALTSIGSRPEDQTIGMAPSKLTESRRGFNGYHVERFIDADMPVSVDYGYGGVGSEGGTCPQIRATFVPEPGINYEAWLDVQREARRCVIRVARILPGGDLLPEPLSPAPECPPGP